MDDDRLIIILGMVQSGTTILTHVLRQHPQIYLFYNGLEAKLLQNDLVILQDTEAIKQLLEEHSERVLLKCTSRCYINPDWFMSTLHRAFYVYCYKSVEEQIRSWAKPNSYHYEWLRTCEPAKSRDLYVQYWNAAMDFARRARHFKKFPHSEFLKSPQETINDLTKWLGLPAHTYDTSAVSPSIDVKKIIGS